MGTGPSAAPAASPAVAPSVSASPAASPAPSPTPGPPLAGTIKIVSSLPRSGSSKDQTDAVVNAIQMALAEVNNKVGNATIVYQDLDDATAAAGKWDPAQETQNANAAVNDPDVMLYIGPFNSGAASLSIPVLCKANLAMISPSTTYPGLTKKVDGVQANEPDVYYQGCRRNFLRVVPTDDIQGENAANWSKQLGATKAYILEDSTDGSELFGHALAAGFAQEARRVGLSVVGGPDGMDPTDDTYRPLARTIAATDADLVYFGGITQNSAGQLWQDLDAILPDGTKLMGSDGIYEQAFLDAAGSARNGTFVTFGAIPPAKLTGAGATWYNRYQTQYKTEPGAYAAYAYEATRVALDAINRAGSKDRARIRDALFATRNYAGVLGSWSFTDSGDTTLTTMSGRQVEGGVFDDANATLLTLPQ